MTTTHEPAATIRAVRFTSGGGYDVITIPARYDALADAIGAPHRVGDIGITSAATWKMPGAGYLTFWTARPARGGRNEAASRVASRLVPKASGSIDRISDGITGGVLAGTVVLAGYDRDSGGPADIGDVAVERVGVAVDGRLTTAAPAVETAAMEVPPPTAALPADPDPVPEPAPDTPAEPEPDPAPVEAVTKRQPAPKRQRTPGPVS